jgi:tetratricopeptide (TPR) repeat protein
MNKAYEYYYEAYGIDNSNFYASLNLARYFFRIKDYETSKKMFEYSLLIESKVTKSEIYFSLSSIELEIN